PGAIDRGGGGAGLGLCASRHPAGAGAGPRRRAAGPRLDVEGQGLSGDLETRLEAIVRAAPRLMTVLETARDLALPDWMIFSGAVYHRVPDHLTGRDPACGS